MLKVKTTVGEAPLEVEAPTKQELEDALDVALRVMNRVNMTGIHNSFREPETLETKLSVPSTPPPQVNAPVGGETSQNIEPESVTSPLTVEDADPKIRGVSGHEAMQLEITDAQEENTLPHVSYRKAKSIVDYAIIALQKMGELYGTNRSYTTTEIMDFLKKTGGDKKLKTQASPTGALGQALRHTPNVLRSKGDNRLKEWINEEPNSTTGVLAQFNP